MSGVYLLGAILLDMMGPIATANSVLGLGQISSETPEV